MVRKSQAGHRKRWVPLLAPALQAIRLQFEHTGAKGTWVFNNPVSRDRWQNSTRLLKRWTRALKMAGVQYRSQYQTRHTYASILMSAGESAPYVAETMGHQDHRLVALVYARFVEQRDLAPGDRTVQLHQAEWSRLSLLLAENGDLVTEVDKADELEGYSTEPDEVDPTDALLNASDI